MCVIVLSNGKEVSSSILSKCFRSNPDGAGIGWVQQDAVFYSKGWMNFNNFYNFYKNNVPKNTLHVIHFRISTSGGKDADMTHPFDLTTLNEVRNRDPHGVGNIFDQYDDYILNSFEKEKVMQSNDGLIFHNGIMDGGGTVFSDTFEFASYLVNNYDIGKLTKEEFKTAIKERGGSTDKIILLKRNKDSYGFITGNFFKYNNFIFSNLNW